MEPSHKLDTPAGPEAALVLACATGTLDDWRRKRIRRLAANDLDWRHVRDLGDRHCVTPLVRESLAAACPDLLPDDVRAGFDTLFRSHAARNLGQVAELVRIVRLFDAAGIDVVSFKGPVLSLLAYGNHSARLYGDLDLLVRERDLDRAIRMLEEAGYTSAASPDDAAHRSHWTPYEKDLVFVNDARGGRVELHWRLTGSHFPFPLDLEPLWRGAATVNICGTEIRTIPADDLLLYLCLHGSRHGWERLGWVCDVAALVTRQGDWDWRRLAARARSLGCSRNLRLGLLLASRLAGARLPSAVLAGILRDSSVCRIADGIRDDLFAPPGREIGGWRGYHLSVRERLRDRARLHLYYLYRYARLATRASHSDPSEGRSGARFDLLRGVARPFLLGYRYGIRPATLRIAGALAARGTRPDRTD